MNLGNLKHEDDVGASPVGNQAGAEGKSTGRKADTAMDRLIKEDILDLTNEEEAEVFSRRSSLQRTPPQRVQRTRSQPEGDSSARSIFQASGGEITLSNRPNKKRKAKESPQQVMPVEASDALLKVRDRVRELVDFSKKKQNVHRDIKRLAGELNSLINMCITEAKHERAMHVEAQEKYENLRRQEEARLTNMEKREASSQTAAKPCACGRRPEPRVERLDVRSLALGGYEEVEAVLGKEWAPESFVATKLSNSDPLKENSGNLVILCDKQEDSRSKWEKRVCERYPELLDSARMGHEWGDMSSMELTTKYKEDAVGEQTKTRNIIMLFYDKALPGEDLERVFYHMNKEVEKVSRSLTTKDIIMTTPRGVQGETARKIVEAVFRKLLGRPWWRPSEHQNDRPTADKRQP